ncbi:MAG: capsular biosynthesis protein [Pelagibacterium sp. SCN 63-23]|nr:MAG: capsular biosynthesis protein [Pelagibacterium sp. SCN 63-23]
MIQILRMQALALPRRWKQAILIAFDFTALSFALWVSFCLRYDSWYVPRSVEQWAIIFAAPIVAIPIFIRMGLYRAVVRYLPERAMWTILQAMLMSIVAWVVLIFLSEMAGRGVVPRSVPIIYFGIGTFIIGGSRFAAKWLFLSGSARRVADRRGVIIYGAGDAGIQLAQSLRTTHRVVGFLDDNPSLHRRELGGVRVHDPAELRELVHEYAVSDVILSIPSLTSARRKEIVESVNQYGLKIRALPSIVDLVSGKYLVNQVREIEIDDLLGRSTIPPDLNLIRDMIVGHTIMVTGAGGSIGSELCRKIARWQPQRLVLFEANEFALYKIEKELAEIKDLALVPILGSVTDGPLVQRTIRRFGIDVILHAAAHKHVPLVEANALEGIRNNVLGTKTLVDAALDLDVHTFVLISTDKAVRPTNVMGATKRWAELIVREAAGRARQKGSGQRYCAVRFGNVLGSNGSVVPLFREQIASGGPVTLTDPAMTRYFMSISEAAELIVQAGSLAEGGDVFLLDMGEPILISELAENMIGLAGFTVKSPSNPGGDIEIVVSGKRPGEKLYEELFYDENTALATRHPKILRAPGSPVESVYLGDEFTRLSQALKKNDEHAARSILFEVIRARENISAKTAPI